MCVCTIALISMLYSGNFLGVKAYYVFHPCEFGFIRNKFGA